MAPHLHESTHLLEYLQSLNAGNYGAKLMRRFGVFNTVSVFDAAEVTQLSECPHVPLVRRVMQGDFLAASQ